MTHIRSITLAILCGCGILAASYSAILLVKKGSMGEQLSAAGPSAVPTASSSTPTSTLPVDSLSESGQGSTHSIGDHREPANKRSLSPATQCMSETEAVGREREGATQLKVSSPGLVETSSGSAERQRTNQVDGSTVEPDLSNGPAAQRMTRKKVADRESENLTEFKPAHAERRELVSESAEGPRAATSSGRVVEAGPPPGKIRIGATLYPLTEGIEVLLDRLSPDRPFHERILGAAFAGNAGEALVGTRVVPELSEIYREMSSVTRHPPLGTNMELVQELRRTAAQALAKIGDPRSRALFKSEIAGTEDPVVRFFASKYLSESLFREDINEVVEAALKGLAIRDSELAPAQRISVGCMHILCRIADTVGVPRPVWIADDPDERVRVAQEWWDANKATIIKHLPEAKDGSR